MTECNQMENYIKNVEQTTFQTSPVTYDHEIELYGVPNLPNVTYSVKVVKTEHRASLKKPSQSKGYERPYKFHK